MLLSPEHFKPSGWVKSCGYVVVFGLFLVARYSFQTVSSQLDR